MAAISNPIDYLDLLSYNQQNEQSIKRKMRRNEKLYRLEKLYVKEATSQIQAFYREIQKRLSYFHKPTEAKSLCTCLLDGLTDQEIVKDTLIKDGKKYCKIGSCDYPHSFADYFAWHITYHHLWRTSPCKDKEKCLYKVECNHVHPGQLQRIVSQDDPIGIFKVYEPKISKFLSSGYIAFLNRMEIEHQEEHFIDDVKDRMRAAKKRDTKPEMCMIDDEISECLGSPVCLEAHTAAEYLADALLYSKFWKTGICRFGSFCRDIECFNLHEGDYTPMNGKWDDFLNCETNLWVYSLPRQTESDEKMPFNQ